MNTARIFPRLLSEQFKEGIEAYLQWAGDSRYPFQAHHYRGIHHMDLLHDDGVLKAIGDIVNLNAKKSHHAVSHQ